MEGQDTEELPCKLLEYFQVTPAVETAPITLPARPYFDVSFAAFSCKRREKDQEIPVEVSLYKDLTRFRMRIALADICSLK